ncbi:MAG: CinA family protein [Alphaproteobacteria bacterium]|nr:CinA family protein [Alphaproteobacteria bacterium]
MSKKIEQLVENLSLLLKDKGLMLSTAESCTGGLIAAAITNRAGSSQIFDRGYVTYSNQAKQEMLSVTEDIIKNYGAVSSECASSMVEGALKNSSADLAVSVTGIAGPDGGSAEKPVGLVYFGVTSKSRGVKTFECHFKGSRHEIRRQSVIFALETLIDYV